MQKEVCLDNAGDSRQFFLTLFGVTGNRWRKLSIVASYGRELGDFGGSHRLCSRMRLWEFPDQYILQPTDRPSTAQNLVIDRTSGELTTIGELDFIPPWSVYSNHCHRWLIQPIFKKMHWIYAYFSFPQLSSWRDDIIHLPLLISL